MKTSVDLAVIGTGEAGSTNTVIDWPELIRFKRTSTDPHLKLGLSEQEERIG